MDDISEISLGKTDVGQFANQEYVDKYLRFLHSRNEISINIGLTSKDEIRQIKNRLKSLEANKAIPSTSGLPSLTKKSSVSDSQLEQTFDSLVKQWKEDTINLSSIHKMVLHPAYQQIIGLGPEAISLILNELKNEPDFWFWALRALTRANPVTNNMAGDLTAMTRVWLDWGREHGHH